MKKVAVALLVGLLSVSGSALAESKGGGSFWDKTTVTGQFNSSYNWNFNNPTLAAGNALRVFDARHDSFNFNLAEIALENAPNDWAKFRLDLDFGQDVAVVDATKGAGIGVDEFGVQQAYAELTAPVGNGLTFKIGHFVTPMGYEVIESAYNLNTSRSVLFGFAIPFTHTGILATYPVTDKFSATIGVVNGWDLIADNNKGKTVIGQLVYKAMDTLTLSVQGSIGPEQPAADRSMRGIVDVVGTWTPNEQWTVGVNYDLGKEQGIGGSGFPNWQGGALYVHYKPFDFVGLTLRGEVFQDDGSRTTLANLTYGEGTGTLHFYMGDGWETRVELRHDQADRGAFVRSSGATRKYQDTVSTEIVYAF